ncbi:unnamed protein product [Mycena citricolor]|uniref:Uncharacterized protein n=1 Tax=Mycena citricolor TaxID=2018698 RepID=A0AAD2Q6K4_9AGAR|nr:unnamed protein product [Mycena citricolor]CAK5281365.1 unnamed protein product [Mycena citricolor]
MPTGRLAKKPIRNEASAATAAVEIMRSFRTSPRQTSYSGLEPFGQWSGVGQTQVAPESARIAAFTEI